MIILGLTGSIGMGKSTTAKFFANEGVPVFDADAAVHRLYQEDKDIIEAISKRFPGAVNNKTIDRDKLGKEIQKERDAIKALEGIVHPAVAKARAKWLESAEDSGVPIVLFDIPLLFETGGEAQVDFVVVVSAPPETQRRRVLDRPGMTTARFERLLSLQTPDKEKRQRADFIIYTSKGLEDAAKQVQSILHQLKTGRTDGQEPVLKGKHGPRNSL